MPNCSLLEFQFHEGPIKTDSIKEKAVLESVSIP